MEYAVVTGASGFLGKWFVRRLLEKGCHICAVVREGSPGILELSKMENVLVVSHDMSDLLHLHEKLPSWYQADTFYHLAWAGTCGNLRADYSLQLLNAKYTCDAVHAAAMIGCQRFVGAGSMAELDAMGYVPLDRSMPNATVHYAAAKLAAEYMSKAECNQMGLEYVWGIFSNIYGVGNTTSNFVNFAAKCMLEGRRAAFTDGMQNYDFVYVTDFIEGLYQMGKYGRNNCSYVIGSGYPQTMREYIQQIRDAIDPTIQLYFGEIPYHGVSLPKEQLKSNKLMEDTGYQPRVSFQEGIRMTVAWLKESYGK